jgi:septal ring factor EnvC (AmiA/AmiB activator)
MPLREARAAAVLLATLSMADPILADEAADTAAGQKLEDVERAIEAGKARAIELEQRAAAAASELTAVRQRLIQAAKAVQEQEQQISDIESTLDELRLAERDDVQALDERRGQLALTLAALERLAVYPREAILALPESPVDTVRSALLLRAAIPEVESRAVKLGTELRTLGDVRRQISAERAQVQSAKQQLATDRQQLADLLARKVSLYHDLESERQSVEDRITAYTAQAKDLRELMDRIEAERVRREALPRMKSPPPPAASAPSASGSGARLAVLPPGKPTAIRPIGEAQGRLTPPVRGEVARGFGASDAYGTASRGITIRTQPQAQVVAPYDGQVVFAGPFRGYGQILIIEHSEGYHSLLAGLSRIDAAAGQWVLAGEPVGVMGQYENGDPELYVELRRNGRPINPLPWLALHNGKVNG